MSESDTSTSRLVIDESVNESRVERYEEGKKILAELGLKVFLDLKLKENDNCSIEILDTPYVGQFKNKS